MALMKLDGQELHTAGALVPETRCFQI